MNLARYKIMDKSVLVKYLERELKLSEYQKDIIYDVIDHMPYRIISFECNKKYNPLFRLTIPFYVIYFLLLLCAIPFKWIITGKTHYKYEGKFLKLLYKWQKVLSF